MFGMDLSLMNRGEFGLYTVPVQVDRSECCCCCCNDIGSSPFEDLQSARTSVECASLLSGPPCVIDVSLRAGGMGAQPHVTMCNCVRRKMQNGRWKLLCFRPRCPYDRGPLFDDLRLHGSGRMSAVRLDRSTTYDANT
jgi:hypothetical protein